MFGLKPVVAAKVFGVGIERLRDATAEWALQFEALGLNPQQVDRSGITGLPIASTEPQLCKSTDQPSSVVDIELNRAFFPHLQ